MNPLNNNTATGLDMLASAACSNIASSLASSGQVSVNQTMASTSVGNYHLQPTTSTAYYPQQQVQPSYCQHQPTSNQMMGFPTQSTITIQVPVNLTAVPQLHQMRIINNDSSMTTACQHPQHTPHQEPIGTITGRNFAAQSSAQSMDGHQQPITVQQQPISVQQQQPISVQQQPIAVQQQPINVQQQPITVQQQPITVQQQPINVQQQPIHVQQQPITVQQQPMSVSYLPQAPIQQPSNDSCHRQQHLQNAPINSYNESQSRIMPLTSLPSSTVMTPVASVYSNSGTAANSNQGGIATLPMISHIPMIQQSIPVQIPIQVNGQVHHQTVYIPLQALHQAGSSNKTSDMAKAAASTCTYVDQGYHQHQVKQEWSDQICTKYSPNQVQMTSSSTSKPLPSSTQLTAPPSSLKAVKQEPLITHTREPQPPGSTPECGQSSLSADGFVSSQGKVKRTACSCPNCQQQLPSSQSPTSTALVTTSASRLHICHYPECGKTYGKTSHLRAHLRWHKNERPFVCSWDLCGKSFTRSDELQRHERIHTGVKNFICNFCDKRFLRSDHLAKHVKIHTNASKSNLTRNKSVGTDLKPVMTGLADILNSSTYPCSSPIFQAAADTTTSSLGDNGSQHVISDQQQSSFNQPKFQFGSTSTMSPYAVVNPSSTLITPPHEEQDIKFNSVYN